MAKEWTGERLETFVFNEAAIEHLHRYAFARELVKDKEVLDIACGEGYGSNILAETAGFVYAVDIDRETIDQASKKYRRNNLSFIQGPAEKIVFDDGRFDVVVSFETIEHITEQESMLSEIKRVLKPGGLLIISTPDKKNYSDKPAYKNPFHRKELYQEDFEQLLKTHFHNHILFYQNFYLASLITNDKQLPLTIYDGDFERIWKKPMIEPLFFLAVCSDSEIPGLNPSIFTGTGTFERALSQKERDIKNSWSYKLGHALLYPVKFLFGLLTKK